MFPSTFTPHTQCKFSPTLATDIQSVYNRCLVNGEIGMSRICTYLANAAVYNRKCSIVSV